MRPAIGATILLATVCLFPAVAVRTAEPYLPALPEVLGLPFSSDPIIFGRRLESLGYSRTSWELAAPFTHIVYELPDAAATFQRVELFFCNHPLQMSRLTISGRDYDTFYTEAKKRFGLGESQWQPAEGPNFRHGRYHAKFAGNIQVTLDKRQARAVLLIEAADIEARCRKTLADDVETLNQADREREAALRKQQRDSF